MLQSGEVTTCDLVIASRRLSNLGVVTLCLRVPNELQSRRPGLAPWTPVALVAIGVATRDALAAADDHVLPEACLVDTVGATDRSSGRPGGPLACRGGGGRVSIRTGLVAGHLWASCETRKG
jgi:hypothetical protein